MTQTLLEPRRVTRDPDDRFLAGVASGVARHLGLQPMVVRVAFLVMVLWSGFGVLLYAGLWAFVPLRHPGLDSPDAPGLASATRRGFRAGRSIRRRDVGVVASIGAMALGGIVLLQYAGLWVSPRLFWPLLVAATGLALLWWQADEGDRAAWLSTSGGWKAWLRILIGVSLLTGAVFLALFQAGVAGTLDDALGAIILAVVGVGLVLGPWLVRLNRDLRRERGERIRTQERADVAAHLHDSVLQTLAMIQRQAGDAQVVSQLARTQERELRTWLFESPDANGATLKTALQESVNEVEAAHHLPVELVVVGDHPMDTRGSALVAATREAMVNAAKHSGASRIDVYAEVGAEETELFVRDRGVGFELAEVPDDRLGVRRSIIDRLERHGGRAEVRSDQDNGTEVRLTLPHTNTLESSP